jgi:hypothetical protein
MVMGFIEAHHKDLGIEPICRELAVAPSSWHEHAARLADASKRSARAQRDDTLRAQIERAHAASFGLYGRLKIWHQLRREGTKVAKCTVERLMRAMGLAGIRRGKKTITTVGAAKALCPLDKVNREFKVTGPNALWVVDFTYVHTWAGFVYVAFVIDAFARRIAPAGSPAACANGRSSFCARQQSRLDEAPDKKSFTSVNSPILACNVFTSIAGAAGSAWLSDPKTPAAPSSNCPRQVVIWFG